MTIVIFVNQALTYLLSYLVTYLLTFLLTKLEIIPSRPNKPSPYAHFYIHQQKSQRKEAN